MKRPPRTPTTRQMARYDEHVSANMDRILRAYHARHVEPLRAYLRLPWYRRLWRRAP